MKKRVLVLTHSLHGGGTQKYVRDLASYMSSDGYEVTVFILSKHVPDFENIEISNFVCYHLPLSSSWQKIQSDFYQILDRNCLKFDAVFANSYDSYKLLNMQDRIPLKKQYYVIHADYFGMYYRWYKPFSNLKRSNKYKKLFNGKNLIVNSDGVGQNLCQKIGISPRKLEVIPPPVDILAINVAANAVVNTVFELPVNFIAVIGTLSALKRVHLAIELMEYLPDDMHLVIVGSGREECRLKQLASKYKKRILFLGWVENPYAILSKAKCLVNMSLSEGFSLVLVESLAIGVPPLSIKSVGPESILKENFPEFLFENSGTVLQKMASFIIKMPRYNSKYLISEAQKYDISNACIKYKRLLSCE